MAKYQVSGIIDGTNIKTVTKKVADVFGEKLTVKKIEPATSRSDRLAEAESDVDSARAVVEELRDELQEWLDNMPENLQGGTKADEVQSAIDGLEEILSSLEGIEFSGVDFPGMF